MRPHSRVWRSAKKNARRFKSNTNTEKKRSALRGGLGPQAKRRRNEAVRRAENEQAVDLSTPRVPLPIAPTPKGSPHFPSASPSTSKEQMTKVDLSKNKTRKLANRFTQFVRCLLIVWRNACRHSENFRNYVNAFARPTGGQSSTYGVLCRATQVVFDNGLDASVPYCDDIVKRQLSLVITGDVARPSVMIERWPLFHFVFKNEEFRYIITSRKLDLGLTDKFNEMHIMIWLSPAKRGNPQNGTILLSQFPMKLRVIYNQTAGSQSNQVELQFQGLTFAYSVNPDSREMIENFSIVYVRGKTAPTTGVYLMYESKSDVSERIAPNHPIPCEEGLLALYTI